MIRALVPGTTQDTETVSLSMKAWRIGAVQPDGMATIEHRVEWVDMRQRLKDSKEVHYDSRTDRQPPPGFQTVARSVGVPLSILKMDATGKILARRQLVKPAAKDGAKPAETPLGDENWVTIPLPREPVPIGHTWSIPQTIDVPLEGGMVKRIKAVQQFTLEEVKTGVATIRFSTDVLTPVTDPMVESQLVQRESVGRVRFDIDEGRILSQQIDIDKHVVGFRGDASSIHYVNRFSERLARRAQRGQTERAKVAHVSTGSGKGTAPYAGTARRVLRTNGACPLFPPSTRPTAWRSRAPPAGPSANPRAPGGPSAVHQDDAQVATGLGQFGLERQGHAECTIAWRVRPHPAKTIPRLSWASASSGLISRAFWNWATAAPIRPRLARATPRLSWASAKSGLSSKTFCSCAIAVSISPCSCKATPRS